MPRVCTGSRSRRVRRERGITGLPTRVCRRDRSLRSSADDSTYPLSQSRASRRPSILAGSGSFLPSTALPPASRLGNGLDGSQRSQDYSLILIKHTTSPPVWHQWRNHLLKSKLLSPLNVNYRGLLARRTRANSIV